MAQGAIKSSQDNQESIHRWIEHAYDPSKMSVDDPLWLDADGDGCNIYKYAIESGRMARADACDGGAPDEAPTAASAGRLRGAKVIADRTAKAFCRKTCGMC